MRKNERGEIITILTIAAVVVMGIATVVTSSLLNNKNNKQTIKTKAMEPCSCRGGSYQGPGCADEGIEPGSPCGEEPPASESSSDSSPAAPDPCQDNCAVGCPGYNKPECDAGSSSSSSEKPSDECATPDDCNPGPGCTASCTGRPRKCNVRCPEAPAPTNPPASNVQNCGKGTHWEDSYERCVDDAAVPNSTDMNCGNGTCAGGETPANCPEDCSANNSDCENIKAQGGSDYDYKVCKGVVSSTCDPCSLFGGCFNQEDCDGLKTNPNYNKGTCFPSGTKILLSDWTTKEIQNIKVGDKVISYNLSANKTIADTVGQTFTHPNTGGGYYLLNNSLKVTGNHPVWVNNNEWREVSSLKTGDYLMDPKGDLVKIESIRFIPGVNTVYSLHLNGDDHNYFTEGFLVHNSAQNTGSKATGTDRAGCFLAGTEILTPYGGKKMIEDLKIGDTVLSYDVSGKQTAVNTITQTFTHPNTGGGYYLINNSLKVTGNHPIWVNNTSWKEASYLKIGDYLLDSHNNLVAVESIEKKPGIYTVYNLEVENTHTYFAGGILVHNKPKGAPRNCQPADCYDDCYGKCVTNGGGCYYCATNKQTVADQADAEGACGKYFSVGSESYRICLTGYVPPEPSKAPVPAASDEEYKAQKAKYEADKKAYGACVSRCNSEDYTGPTCTCPPEPVAPVPPVDKPDPIAQYEEDKIKYKVCIDNCSSDDYTGPMCKCGTPPVAPPGSKDAYDGQVAAYNDAKAAYDDCVDNKCRGCTVSKKKSTCGGEPQPPPTYEAYKKPVVVDPVTQYEADKAKFKACVDNCNSDDYFGTNCTCGSAPIPPAGTKDAYDIDMEKYYTAKQNFDECMAGPCTVEGYPVKCTNSIKKSTCGSEPPQPSIPDGGFLVSGKTKGPLPNVPPLPTEIDLAQVKAKYGLPPGAGDSFDCRGQPGVLGWQGNNCDKCGYAGWWGSGCDGFILSGGQVATKANDRFLINGPLSCYATQVQAVKTSCGNQVPVIITNDNAGDNLGNYKVAACKDETAQACYWLAPSVINGTIQVMSDPTMTICMYNPQTKEKPTCIKPVAGQPAAIAPRVAQPAAPAAAVPPALRVVIGDPNAARVDPKAAVPGNSAAYNQYLLDTAFAHPNDGLIMQTSAITGNAIEFCRTYIKNGAAESVENCGGPGGFKVNVQQLIKDNRCWPVGQPAACSIPIPNGAKCMKLENLNKPGSPFQNANAHAGCVFPSNQ